MYILILKMHPYYANRQCRSALLKWLRHISRFRRKRFIKVCQAIKLARSYTMFKSELILYEGGNIQGILHHIKVRYKVVGSEKKFQYLNLIEINELANMLIWFVFTLTVNELAGGSSSSPVNWKNLIRYNHTPTKIYATHTHTHTNKRIYKIKII